MLDTEVNPQLIQMKKHSTISPLILLADGQNMFDSERNISFRAMSKRSKSRQIFSLHRKEEK